MSTTDENDVRRYFEPDGSPRRQPVDGVGAHCARAAGSALLASLLSHCAMMAPERRAREGGRLLVAATAEIERLNAEIDLKLSELHGIREALADVVGEQVAYGSGDAADYPDAAKLTAIIRTMKPNE